MKDYSYDINSFSHDTFNIGGIKTYVYNLKALDTYIKEFNSHLEEDAKQGIKPSKLNVNVLYLVHPRDSNYKYTEAIAYKVLGEINTKRIGTPLICVTFDIRNHGSRLADAKNNQDWSHGNDTHGLDMISVIDGTLTDLKSIIDFLPGYLNLDVKISEVAQKELEETVSFTNTLSGFSIGAHTVIRYANKYPKDVSAIFPAIGCHDMTSLLIGRLLKIDISSPKMEKKWFYHNYDELDLSEEQKSVQYPKHLHKYLAARDSEIFESYPFSSVKLFATFGSEDALVPHKISSAWVNQYLGSNPHSEAVVEEGVGHAVTQIMIEKFVTWFEAQLQQANQ